MHHYFQPFRWSAAAGVPITYVMNEKTAPSGPRCKRSWCSGCRLRWNSSASTRATCSR